MLTSCLIGNVPGRKPRKSTAQRERKRVLDSIAGSELGFLDDLVEKRKREVPRSSRSPDRSEPGELIDIGAVRGDDVDDDVEDIDEEEQARRSADKKKGQTNEKITESRELSWSLVPFFSDRSPTRSQTPPFSLMVVTARITRFRRMSRSPRSSWLYVKAVRRSGSSFPCFGSNGARQLTRPMNSSG